MNESFDLSASLRTGDAVLFSNNCPTGFILRTLASSVWNHGAVAVRIVAQGTGSSRISLTEEGELYFLETNTHLRHDDIFGKAVTGVAFSKGDWLLTHYNCAAVRRLRSNFRTPWLAEKTWHFAQLNHGIPFTTTTLSFFPAFAGFSFTSPPKLDVQCAEAFCSQLMATYYLYAVGGQYSAITHNVFDGRLATLFGSGCPEQTDMITPGHFSSQLTPSAPIFAEPTDVIYRKPGDIIYVLFQPLLLLVAFLVVLFYTLQEAPR